MGIVIKQSIKNTIITLLGFGIGAANTLFMYPYFLGKDYFGLTGYVLSAANILYPIMSFGIQNTLIKFFNENNKTEKELNSYITYMLFVPLFFITPLMLLFFFFYNDIALYESQKNSFIYDFVWVIPIIGIFMGYFEIFYAWLRAHMKSVFGSFVKEVFVRILITILLFAVYFEYISPADFIYSLVLVYGIGLLLIVFYANKVKNIRLHFKTPKNSKAILTFTVFIILSASIANMLLDIDKYMNLNGLEAVWAKNVKHLNTRIWPGTDSLMFLILDNEKANLLLEELRQMKKTLMDGVGFFVLVSPIEEII